MTTPAVIAPPPCDPLFVVEVWQALDKALRAHQLYLPNNPAYTRAVDAARAAMRKLWMQVPEMPITVTDAEIVWHGVIVHESKSKGGDSIPWLLYKDGLREALFYPGFEGAEIVKLLRAFSTVRRAKANEDDLLTVLWEQDFEFLQYRYVETHDTVPPLTIGETPGLWSVRPEGAPTLADALAAVRASAPVAAAPRPRASALLRAADFDVEADLLGAAEMEYLREETRREYELDVRRAVVGALMDIFEQQTDAVVRAEVVEHLEALIVQFIDTGHFNAVAYSLRELLLVLDRAAQVTPEDRGRLGRLADRMSQRETLTRMLEVLEEADRLPSEDDLAELFDHLRVGAIDTLLGFSTRARNAQLRPILSATVERLAISHTADIVRLVADEREEVAREAIRLAGALGVSAAVPPLGEVVRLSAETTLRTAAIAALNAIGTSDAVAALAPAITDADREIRVHAMRTLAARRYAGILPRVGELLTGKAAREMDRTERIALFELFGSVCGDAGIAQLEPMLATAGGLFSRGGDSETRACAAIALGRIGTESARTVLAAHATDKDPIVRSAVARALRTGGTA